MTAEEVLDEVEEDRVFYENSSGGVTFSGGEPSVQFEFLNTLLDESGRRGFHRVVETNGHVPRERFKVLVSNSEMILFDIKHLDTIVHHRYTGAGNELILSNLGYLKENGVSWIPRVPLIPGVNDDPTYIGSMAGRLAELKPKEVHLLPYHKFGETKAAEIGLSRREFAGAIQPPSVEESETAAEIIRSAGLRTYIGGNR